MFSLIASPYCPNCSRIGASDSNDRQTPPDVPIEAYHATRVAEYLQGLPQRRALLVTPITWTTKSGLSEQLFELQASGWIRLIVEGKTIELSQTKKELAAAFPKSGSASVVIDRFRIATQLDLSLRQSIEHAFDRSPEEISVLVECEETEQLSAKTPSVHHSQGGLAVTRVQVDEIGRAHV